MPSKKKSPAKKQASKKSRIVLGIEKGMQQVDLIEKGKLKAISMKQLKDVL